MEKPLLKELFHKGENMRILETGYWQGEEKLHHSCCEPLCNWMIEFLKEDITKPLYDFGCGYGQYLRRFADAGFINMIGFEGATYNSPYNEFKRIVKQDLTIPFQLPLKGNCIFLEVAEHIPAKYENIMLDNVINACSDKLIMSWAVRGQDGWGHINCVNNDEAIAKLTSKGMIYCAKESKLARDSISDADPNQWFRNTTLVFKK